jgi:hypothetical protein
LEFLDKFLHWLYEDTEGGMASPSSKRIPKRALLEAPKIPKQITQHSLPSPKRLAQIAAAYQAKQLQALNEQYDVFFQSGYPNFVQWVESQVEKSAAFGGRFLLLTFDNSTGIVTAATQGQREVATPNSYALPISQSAVQKLATAVSGHFRKAEFTVRLERVENSFSRTGVQLTAACDHLDILWAEASENESRANRAA